MRPKLTSGGNRKLYDKRCHSVKKNSKFVIYDDTYDAKNKLFKPNVLNYLNKDNDILYADVGNYSQLLDACSENCPYKSHLKCPCIGVYDKVYKKNCELGVFDTETCAPISSTEGKLDKVDMRGSLLASCYCYFLMNDNLNKYGIVKGMGKSYKTDNDLCESSPTLHLSLSLPYPHLFSF